MSTNVDSLVSSTNADIALQLLHDPQVLYEQMAPEERRLMNQAIDAKLYVYEDKGPLGAVAVFEDQDVRIRRLPIGGT